MMVCELQHESRCERRGLHHGDVEEPDQTSSGGRPLMRLPGGGCLRQPEAGGESVGCGAALAGLGEADMMSAGRRRARVIMDTS